MKVFTRRRVYVNLITAAIISLLITFPMILEIIGFNSVGSQRDAFRPEVNMGNLFTLIKSLLFFTIMIFSILTIYTLKAKILTWTTKIVAALILTVAFYLLSPVIYRPIEQHEPMHAGYGIPVDIAADAHRPEAPGRNKWIEVRRIIEFSFILAITGLIGKIFELTKQSEQISIENEKLRAENLQSQYNILLKQVNPHFFFNSMNSLSTLVREGRKDSALRYIGEMSDTYRYMLQNSGKELVTLEEEMKALSGFCYMLLIRYEGKLFFNIDVGEELMKMLLPVFSLQPLVENAVKHNTLTAKQPLTIFINSGSSDRLTITNQIIPRQRKEEQSGTGLNNLTTRFRLLTGREILIEDNGKEFRVTLPLIKKDVDESTNS